MSKKADSPDSVPRTFLVCRAFRHELRFITDAVTRGAGNTIVEFKRISRCTNCHTEVHVTYSVPDWRVKKRVYIYPDNYSVKGGYGVYDARDDFLKVRFS